MIRFFLWMQSFTGLKWRYQVMLFLPIYFLQKSVFAIHWQLAAIIRSLTVYGCIQGNIDIPHDHHARSEKRSAADYYVMSWNWLAGVTVWMKDPPADWTWQLEPHWWVDVLLWVFVVIPIVLFTYYIYEPKFSRDFRLRYQFTGDRALTRMSQLYVGTERRRSTITPMITEDNG